MESDRLILCGGVNPTSRSQRWKEAKPLSIGINQKSNAVNFSIESLPKQLITDLPPAAMDLMEIAAYVYAADQACPRGGQKEFEYGEKWRRNLRFEIPVRKPTLWNSDEVKGRLVEALSYLSDDHYEFAFHKSRSPELAENYLFKPTEADGGFDEVMLFSGGLDSFAGAAHEILTSRRRVALVSHVSTGKIGKPQRDLVDAIVAASEPGTPEPLHIQVNLNKAKSMGNEFTQRTRSFVFATFAGLVAHALGRDHFLVYENGIVSFNLNGGLQILGARASRTTHPRSLDLLSKFLSTVLGTPMEIRNPFMWRTKTEILQSLKGSGHARMCAHTISCAHTMQRTTQYSHCGRCSQCIDRRFVALAAGLDRFDDPEEMYSAGWLTPFTDERDKTMIDRYVGNAQRIRSMKNETDFLKKFGEVSKSLSVGPGNAASNLKKIFDLHKRHADQIHGAVVQLVLNHADDIASKCVPPDSPMGILIAGSLTQAGAEPLDKSTRRAGTAGGLRVCDDTLAVHYDGHVCFLGNTNEFRLIARLAKRVNVYVRYDTLIEDVWDGQRVTKASVQKAASNLNRELREANITDIRVESPPGGGSYRLATSAILQRSG